ncbi:hypothetical protein AB832_07460 [Flavobacteriaceae bacterium (ex Bugula neritina AB1)]|nr:hypothetical protein AB832_07460 [Flavobacteriaceae bacterium (ex Bugula neritina AB1)]
MEIVLKREYFKTHTAGVLTLPDGSIFYTIERPWLDNKPYESCIPESLYECRSYSSQKFPDVWEVTDVEDRTYILLHQGNYVHDVEGCIAVGMNRPDSKNMIGQSKKAFFILRERLSDSFDLRIERAS